MVGFRSKLQAQIPEKYDLHYTLQIDIRLHQEDDRMLAFGSIPVADFSDPTACRGVCLPRGNELARLAKFEPPPSRCARSCPGNKINY
ncbi:hypothetical protein EYF80_016907 [Liparis tanakae]|uniref:Uncharacterized protein n=1 Tax=Liparis tanakae TaxID=230148 RepID=A0A4Z2I3Z0_9TELE|nr:hypothetical protein EYF80_016907 [Liparis tanakae]